MITHARADSSRCRPATAAVLSLLALGAVAGASPSDPQPPPAPTAQASPPPVFTESVYCPVCGARNRAGSRFCMKDGSPIPTLLPERLHPEIERDPATFTQEEIQETIHRASRSVVRIRVKGVTDLKLPVVKKQSDLPIQIGELESIEGEARLVGSGFIVGRGEIVTNAHVASPFGRPAQIVIETLDGSSFPAKLKGVDPASDLALLAVDYTVPPPLEWADSNQLRLGDETWAIGDPLDVGVSVTRGTIATLARMRTGMSQVEAFIHSDAFITHGNSGGPLVNVSGRVVGVSDMGWVEERGQGYSIPSFMARLVVDRLRKFGKYERGYLGLHLRQIDGESVTKFGLKRKTGVVVESVLKGAPAEAAGFRPGDVLFGINGRQATSSYLLQEAVSSVGPGTALTLTVDRAGQVLDLKATTALRPQTPRIDPLIDLQTYMMVRFEEDAKQKGVVVRVPDSYSPAPKYGFNDGDVVQSVLAAQDWPDEPLTLDYYRRKRHPVDVDSLADLRSALGRMYLGGRVGVAFQFRRSTRPIAAVAFDERWPIIL